MGAPRPGSGQFYLDDPNGTPGEYQKPRNRWGPTEGKSLRRLRGRKFYWHSDPSSDERRKRWEAHQWTTGDPDRAELLPAGSAWDVELVADGLTEPEIGGLIAALQPHRLFATMSDPLPYPPEGEPEFAIHVGGGKPIGLGSCTVTDLAVTLDDAASRYLGVGSPRKADPTELVAAFAADHTAAMTETWQSVAAALHTTHVDTRILAYPTTQPWEDAEGTPAGKQTYESFKWFAGTVGEQMHKGSAKPFVPLPHIRDIAQGLPVKVVGERA
jgi:hypothetical protein